MVTLSGSGSASSSPLLKGVKNYNPTLWGSYSWVSSSKYMNVSDDIGKALGLKPVVDSVNNKTYYPMLV